MTNDMAFWFNFCYIQTVKRKLENMKKIIGISAFTLLVVACGTSKQVEMEPEVSETTEQTPPQFGRMHFQTDVKATMERIFDIAKSGDVDRFHELASLCNENIEVDSDVRTICEIGSAEKMTQKEFMAMFNNAEVTGSPVIDGDSASIPFKFGPKGERNEVMNLQRVDGKWYLVSF